MITCRASLAYLAVIGALFAGGITANADSVTVTATFANSQPNTVPVDLQSNYNDNDAGNTTTTVSTVAGIYNFVDTSFGTAAGSSPLTLTQVENGLGGPGGTFQAVCIDFTHNITYGQTVTWQVADLTSITTNGVGISSDQANAIAWLWANQPTGTADDDAIFQMAVWDLVYDGSLYSSATPSPTVAYPSGTAFTNGDAAAATAAAAQAWTEKASGGDPVYALISTTGAQSFNFAILGGPNEVAPVPLPASAGVGFGMLAAFGALFAFRKRLTRRPAIA